MLLTGGVWSFRDFRARLEESRADRYMEQHDLWLAERTYRDALSWSHHDGQRLKQHAITLHLLDRTDEALVELREAAQYSGDVGIPIFEAEILTRLGEFDRAIAIYRGVIAAFPKMLTPRFVLAQIYANRGETQLAHEQFKQVIDISPSAFNLNMTAEKIELQKSIARAYLQNHQQAPQ
jgi:tetratricopeptide (TPR) repeat protein